MQKPNEFSRTLKATLYRIASTSRLHHRITHYAGTNGDLKKDARFLSGEWESPYAAIAWGIYERAVLDHFGMGTGTHGFGKKPIYRNDTAKTGMITRNDGKQVNILELLGIDPIWAKNQLKTAVDYTCKQAA